MRLHSDHYAFLGVARDASPEEIRVAYRNYAKRNHPDAAPGDSAAAERFKEVQSIYETLSDPESRQAYDLQLEAFERFVDGEPERQSGHQQEPPSPQSGPSPPPAPEPSSPPPPSVSATPAAPQQPGLATASIICGIIATCFCFAPLGLVAIFCGLKSRAEVDRRGASGSVWKIGFWLGITSCVMFTGLLILNFVIM